MRQYAAGKEKFGDCWMPHRLLSTVMFVPKLRSFDMKFCAHELCPEGTMCHYTEESSPQSYHLHWNWETPYRCQYLTNDQCPGTDSAPVHKGQERRWQQHGYVTQDRSRRDPMYNDRGKGSLLLNMVLEPPLPLLFIWLKMSKQTDCGVFLPLF